MTQRWRIDGRGTVDRSNPLAFDYDGVGLEGYAGDTLASALLANGVHLVGRSFKYHRPRGIYTAGVEEPNALVQLGKGARTEPNARATTVELYDGLVATSQNCWPSVRFDVGAVANALSPLLPAGFYYKTFMWPPTPAWWLRYEHFIRRAAGMGRAPAEPDPDHYEHRYAHCDVLVIGGGFAGLSAARSAARGGARVIVCQQAARFASALVRVTPDHADAAQRFVVEATAELSGEPDVTLLTRTTAFGYYDGSLVAAVERVTEHVAQPPADRPRERLWLIRARAVVLATGVIERGIAYANNDLPGTMLAGAVRTYADGYGVRVGSRAAVFANNDVAYGVARSLRESGVEIAAIVDPRASPRGGGSAAVAMADGIRVLPRSVIRRAHGRLRVTAVDVGDRDGGASTRLDCDVVAVSGGYSPSVHLFSQARGSLRYDAASASFLPDASPLPIVAAGGVRGMRDVDAAIADGAAAAFVALGKARPAGSMPPAAAASMDAAASFEPSGSTEVSADIEPLWAVRAG
ncbi:MAG: 2Fe-2S iron-sulfur cluster-binding protein, partial [Betaproteobacteria bacterium]